jgi:chorismate synthase
MSSFGKIFKITTFGESHAFSVGVIIENCPPKLRLTSEDIIKQLNRRKPGQSSISTDRNEKDIPIILSGIENDITLGTPICVIVYNQDQKPNDYKFSPDNYIYRPSHADFTYWQKYGIHASSGGGRSSARETISRVIAGSIADKYLKETYNIDIVAFVSCVGNIKIPISTQLLESITRNDVDNNIIRCPNQAVADDMITLIQNLKEKGDSVGGIITCVCKNVPAGLGEPCFDKLEALLAQAMMSIPATKGFEIGSGFSCAHMLGSEHNDEFFIKNDKISTYTNFSGGIQGGISNGEYIYFNVAFKPPATIKLEQNSVNMNGENTILTAKGRHDPCVVNRAVPIVESMASLVILDCLFQNKRIRKMF